MHINYIFTNLLTYLFMAVTWTAIRIRQFAHITHK